MESEKKGWWSQRTTMEKVLTVVCALGAIATISLLVSLIVVLVKDDEVDDICLTQACIEESSKVLASMNLEADPCDNFYEFACGTFLKETVIPDDKSQVTAFSVIENRLNEQLRVIINEPIADDEIEPFKNVKKLYKTCMDTTKIEERGIEHVLNMFTALGGWPVISTSWNGDSWTWQRSVALARENGFSVSNFLGFSVSTDNKNTTRRIIRIDQASLGLSREYLIKQFNESFVEAYHSYQVDLAVMFGAERSRAETEMRKVLEFEFELANISVSREDRRDAEKLYNPMNVTELQSKYDYNDWLSYFNSILPEEVAIDSDYTVLVTVPSFFEKLGALIEKTPKETLANYAVWRAAVSSVSYLTSDFRNRQHVYVQATTGKPEQDPRWLQCVTIALNYYPHAFGALYVRKHFKEEAKTIALEMVINIREEFKEMLKEIDWMDAETKKGADEKASSISEQIGFADELLDDAKLVEFYNTWPAEVNEDQYFETIFRLNIASTLRNSKRLHEPIDKKEWSSVVAPAVVNAFYSSIENSIKFPAGILQGAFFNAKRPQYMNYGGIGFVIGHEITHGFDDQGSQYDAEGNLKNWWAEETRDAYVEKTKCIQDQYGNYIEPLTELALNGNNTQGENIADNGGIKESYRAYVRWAKNNPEPKMPGLDYTPQQMFWVAAGQVWCSAYRFAAMKNRVTTGVHSPGQFRVIGPMSNLKEFSDDFQCKVGSTMNPEKKCEVSIFFFP